VPGWAIVVQTSAARRRMLLMEWNIFVDRRVELKKAMNLSGAERNLDVINESEVRLN
jgi:hypothetical protein